MSITAIPDELRTAVVELNGSECLRCGVQCTWSGPTRLHIDHVIPEIHGGPTTLANLQVLCQQCNLSKGARTADYRTAEARAKLARQTALVAREEARRASPYWKLFYFLLILLPFLVMVGLFAVGWWPIGAALFFVILGTLPFNPVLHGMKH